MQLNIEVTSATVTMLRHIQSDPMVSSFDRHQAEILLQRIVAEVGTCITSAPVEQRIRLRGLLTAGHP